MAAARKGLKTEMEQQGKADRPEEKTVHRRGRKCQFPNTNKCEDFIFKFMAAVSRAFLILSNQFR